MRRHVLGMTLALPMAFAWRTAWAQSDLGLLEWVRVPRTLGSLIVVVAAVGVLFGIAASLRGPAQSWLTDPQRFSRLEEKLRPIMVPFKQLQNATEQVEKAAAPRLYEE